MKLFERKNYPLTRDEAGWIVTVDKWINPHINDNDKHNPVYIYQIDSWTFNEKFVIEKIIPILNEFEHSDGLIIVSNIGHHVKIHDDIDRFNHYYSYFQWLNQLMVNNTNSLTIFRETTPTHFPSINNTFRNYIFNETNYKHHIYSCVINNQTYDNKHENYLAKQFIEKSITLNLTINNFKILKIYDYMKLFYKSKPGSCHRDKKNDCLHSCALSPLMYMPIWIDLLHIIKSFIEK